MQARGVDTSRLMYVCALGILLVSLAVLAWSLARLTWVILAEPGYDITVAQPSGAATGEAGAADFSLLERVTPFRRQGGQDRAPEVEVIDAPETTLDLILHGVLMRADTGGVAYISVGEAGQKSYRVGDTIDAAGGVQIRRILPGAVILERDGQQERLANTRANASEGIVTLRDGERPAADAVGAAASDAEAPAPERVERPGTEAAPEPRRARATITRAEAEELAQSIRLDERTGNVEGGFSIFPTRRAELFARAGLRGGDVIQEVGGIRLDTVSDFERVFADLETQSVIDVRLVRQGEPRLLTLQLRDDRGATEGE